MKATKTIKSESTQSNTSAVSGVDRHAKNFAASATVEECYQGPTRVVKVLEALVDYFNSKGQLLSKAKLMLEQRPEDVVSVLPYFVQDKTLQIVVTECFRPASLARSIRGLPKLGKNDGARFIEEIGGYLGELDGLDLEARQVLLQKTGLQSTHAVELLGSIQVSNSEISGEFAVPTALRIDPLLTSEYEIKGQDFNASRVVKVISAQKVVDGFFDGSLTDPRLLDDVLTLHEKLRQRGEVVAPLIFPEKMHAAASKLVQQLMEYSAGTNTGLMTNGSVVDFITKLPNDERVIAYAKVGELQPVINEELYHRYRMLVQNRSSTGKEIGETYDVDAVVRDSDIMHVIVLARIGNQIGMVINQGTRAALEIRGRTPKVIHAITAHPIAPAKSIEGVSGSLTVANGVNPAVGEAVRDLVVKTTGCQLIGEPVLTNLQGYLSLGFNTTGIRFAIAAIDLGPDSQLPPGYAVADPRAMLNAGISQLPLRIAARIADQLVGSSEQPVAWLNPQEREGFNRLMISESALWKFVREHSAHLRELIRHDQTLASIITHRSNDGGLRLEPLERSDKEGVFFNSLMQNSVVHKGDSSLRILQLLWHDCWHFENRDPLPFRLIDGKLAAVGFEEYCAAVMRNEIDAVMYSDVIVPLKFGLKQFEKQTKAGSLAGLLLDCGYIEQEAQREVIRQALETGALPAQMVRFLADSKNFKLYEAVIREKLLGYYVRDTKRNVRVLFDSWLAMPSVAELAYRMGVPLMDEAALKGTFTERLANISSSAHRSTAHVGRNPLQEALGDAATYKIYLPALKLQYLRSMIDTNVHFGIASSVDSIIEELVACYRSLKEQQERVKGVDENESSATAYRTLVQALQGVAKKAALEIEHLTHNAQIVPEAEARFIKERRFSPFPVLEFDPREDPMDQQQVRRLLETAFKAEGVTPPHELGHA